MDEIRCSLCISQICRTVTELMGFDTPEAAAPANSVILDAAGKFFGGEKVERALLYNPDAVALWLYMKYTELFSDVVCRASIALPTLSVMPSVTPVCFASMYTGLMPEKHGIMSYTKPVLKVETIFDSAIKAGKKPIIISTEGDSISKIFLERDMDYIICETPDECNLHAERILREDKHDIVVVYNGNYDGTMHRYGPESEESLAALTHNASAYAKLHDIADEAWTGRRRLCAFLPDHGCHEIDGGCGSHGLDMAEDMNIIHFFDFGK